MLWTLLRFGLYILVYYGLMQCGFMIEVAGGLVLLTMLSGVDSTKGWNIDAN